VRRTAELDMRRGSGRLSTAGRTANQARARRESALERLDRNLDELTGELRVVVTGVQVLFAFLLIVPFNSGFAGIGDFERSVYFVTLVLAALSAACTIAPSAQHRFLFRQNDKAHLVRVANRMVIAGLGFLALAMCGCVLLVASKLFGVVAGVVTIALASIPFLMLWFVMPLRRRRRLIRGARGGEAVANQRLRRSAWRRRDTASAHTPGSPDRPAHRPPEPRLENYR
jgi:Family of unknown function (DUF6328)